MRWFVESVMYQPRLVGIIGSVAALLILFTATECVGATHPTEREIAAEF